MLAREEILSRIDSLNVWKSGDERAPHKPLLLLFALGRLQMGKERMIPFDELAPQLTHLLKEYGPPRQSYHPEHPFLHLRSDRLWETEDLSSLRQRRGKTLPLKSELIKERIAGGFPQDVEAAFAKDPSLVSEVARRLLTAHFPESLHEEILAATGLDLALTVVGQRLRSAAFRLDVVRAYDGACAFCGYTARLDDALLGVEAAHIHWHALGGPDALNNGLACCSLHHRALDRGAIGVDEERRILVSSRLQIGMGTEADVFNLRNRPLRTPNQQSAIPAREFLAWHRRQVFRSPERDI